MSWSDAQIQQVWEKAAPQVNNDPNVWRKDQCGAWLNRAAHGDRNSKWGWEIHHINPNGGDGMANLMPLHWENNLSSADTGRVICVLISDGTTNVKRQPFYA